MSTRRALMGLLCAAVAVVAAGCGGDDQGDDATAKGSGTVRYYNDITPWQEGMEDIGTKLAEVSGVGWKPIGVPDATQYQQLVKQSLRTGKNAADIVKWWSGYRLQELAAAGALTDLSELWEEMEAKGWVAPGIKPAFSYDGKVYGLPFAQSYWVVYYNKRVFEDAGIEPPETWSEFLSNAAELERAGVTPFYTTVQDRWPSFIWFEELLAKLDPAGYNAVVDNDGAYTDPVVKEAMGVWQDLIEKGYFTKPDIKLQDAPAKFKAGDFAMLIAGTWFNQQLTAGGMKSGEDYGAFVMPSIPRGDGESAGPSAFFETSVLAIPANAPNPDAAMTLMKSWLDPKVQEQWSAYLKDVPVNPTLSSSDPVIKDVQKQIADTEPELLNRYFEATPPAIVEGNIDHLANFMLNPSELDSTLQKMQDLATQEWASWEAANGAG